ncbi:DUF4175 family protein [Anaeromyxobacter sp. Fw109-5]|uniref:DUF4175 family protein n=1 Tax=Anaeromyxobacter sp. (strain Fw109-5) TaxID=404589 RepID=UPI000158A8A7|nr:DUF4175 family protein [Anaeromyxobacter sp. Fw109-5]ABS28602.1 conserved hypothetical protein [Anaeromyxobacter sp. Fw109-5]
MTVAYGEIARVLDGARRRRIRVVLLAALGFGLAAGLGVVLAGALAAAFLGVRAGLRPVVLAAACTAVVSAAVLAVRALLRSAWSPEAAARTVAHDAPALRSDLVSSVELARERDAIQASGRYSVALVDEHLARTAARARELDLAAAVPDRWARRGVLALLAVLAVHAAAFLLAGAPLVRAYGRVLLGDPPGTPAPAADPITGDIQLTFQYPAYMKREPRTLSGTGGEIRAPKGTEVTLETRADRDVKQAELVVELEVDPAVTQAHPSTPVPDARGEQGGTGPYARDEGNRREEAGPTPPAHPERSAASGGAESRERGSPVKRYALSVSGQRDLRGRLLVTDGGSYRFRYLDGKKEVAEGPPIPIVVEADAFPEVRITAPERELEADADARVGIEWQAEDDFGLSEAALVVKRAGGEEQRRVLRRPQGLRRDGGVHELDVAAEKLREGDRLTYWVEVLDTDTVSGPKKTRTEAHTLKVYSEAEHRRQVLEKARQVFEELVGVLGDRLETFSAGAITTAERLAAVQQLDVRTRHLHERMREAAREIRRDRAGPKEIAAALQNVAGAIRGAEGRLAGPRASVAQAIRVRIRPDAGLLRGMAALDANLDQELEKGVLYLEQLLDKRRAEDLVRLAKDLASRRRELASLLEKYRASPSDAAKQELLAEIGRMKERVRDLLSQMAELSKGFNDEHMNAEALAEMQRSKDLMGGLDRVEELLAKGDVEAAMKALDEMASSMDQMLAGLQRTAGLPDEKAQALMKEMLAFKDQLEKVKAEQERTATETEQVRQEYRKRLQDRTKASEQEVERLEKLAGEARRDVDRAQPGISYRSEVEYEQSREALADLERALGMKEMGAAWETSQRAAPSVERLSRYLEEDAALSQQTPSMMKRDPGRVADAHRAVEEAVPKAREIRDALSKLFPDPRTVLPPEAQQRLGELSEKQGALEKQAQGLQQKLAELMQQAPIFPPDAQGQLGESRGHMGEAATELGNRNPQRGHGEQQLALDALSRFQKGLEEAAKNQGKGGGSGMGFPFPFGEQGGGEEMGDGREASREKVKIPGAEAYKVPEEFRKDLLDAMRQGAPERYRGEVQRYYEELVK